MNQELRSKSLLFTLVGHAHIDPVWLWDWREGYETVKATFRSALDRLHENPDMVFVHSSAAQYAWMEDHPQLLEEIRAAVQRGQWEPVGGFWVEPDVNLPSGEALLRQGLLGQLEFERLLGRRARVAFLPDSFGHPASLPQLLRGLGLESFVFMRPGPKEIDLPSNLFSWQGLDGTQILALRVECYNSNPLYIDSSLERNLAWRPPHLEEWVGLFGVGNHGGGPTKRAIASIRTLDADPDWPTLRLGSLEAFLKRLEGQARPVYAEPLQYHARGCYAAFSEIKRLNRQCETALLSAEKLAVMAGKLGLAYPATALQAAWKQLLFNQFHDILAGSSIASAYSDARNELGAALATAHRVAYQAMQTVAQQVDTRRKGAEPEEVIRSVRYEGSTWVSDYGDGVPLVVFNPSPWARREALEVEINDWHIPQLRVLDDAGNPLLHQLLPSESASGGRPRVLLGVELPPLGYRVYRIVDEPPATLPAEASELGVGMAPSSGSLLPATYFLENRWWRLEIDPRSGALRALFDKTRGLQLLAGAGAQLLALSDPTDTWGHGLTALRHLLGVFEPTALHICEEGPLRCSLEVRYRYGRSSARQRFSLYRDFPRIEGSLWVDWQETHQALQLAFPWALSETQARYEVPYGKQQRPTDGQEEPSQTWLDVQGFCRDRRGTPHRAGVALLNDSKYSASVLGGEARLTLIRSPVFAHHDPAKLEAGQTYPFQDQGPQTIRWEVLPHRGDLEAAQVLQAAHNLNTPLSFVREYVHSGSQPAQQSFAWVEDASAIHLTALKAAEKEGGIVLRLFEPHGKTAHSRVHCLGSELEVELSPFQIKTFRLEGGSFREVSLLEE